MFPGFGYRQKSPGGVHRGRAWWAIIRAVSTQRFQIVAHRLNAAAVAPFQETRRRNPLTKFTLTMPSGERWCRGMFPASVSREAVTLNAPN